MKLIKIINGPNLNMLGKRQEDIYGRNTIDEINHQCKATAQQYNLAIDFIQSNHEGVIIDLIQELYLEEEKYIGLIINPAGFTHTSIAILDALLLLKIPIIEVHLSDLSKREPFRQHSYTALAAQKQIIGLGLQGYLEAVTFLAKHFGE